MIWRDKSPRSRSREARERLFCLSRASLFSPRNSRETDENVSGSAYSRRNCGGGGALLRTKGATCDRLRMSQNAIGESARAVEATAAVEGPYSPDQLADHVADQAAIVGHVVTDLFARAAVRVAPTDETRAEVRALVARAQAASASAQGHYHASRQAHGDEATRHAQGLDVGDLTHDLPSVVRLCRVLEQYLARPVVVAEVSPETPAALPSGEAKAAKVAKRGAH